MPARAYACIALLLATAPAIAEEETVDVSSYKEKLVVVSDGKGHMLAVVPFTTGDSPEHGRLFYGDGKSFWAQRRVSGGKEGDKAFSNTFWEPRVDAGYKSSFGIRDGKWTVQCDERITELQPLPADEAKAVVNAAKFMAPRWKRQAYVLARDNDGVYFYIDRAREPENNKDFHVFRGPKGALKPQKMTNIVSDSEGEIFVTTAGKLKLIVNKKKTTWSSGTKTSELLPLPVDANRIMIYTELGVYPGEKLGTPCDDL